MLLPSALSCDSSHRNAPTTRFQSAAALFSSPPISPPPNAQSTLFATCRALQSMLSSPNQLPTPPMTHAPAPSSFKLRLRSRKPADGEEDVAAAAAPRVARKRITKRNGAAPRGVNKRRRPVDDDAAAAAAARNITPESDNDENLQPPSDDPMATAMMTMTGPSTPKRMRLAPEVLPRGLERSDFHKLQAPFTIAAAGAAAAAAAATAARDPKPLLEDESSSSSASWCAKWQRGEDHKHTATNDENANNNNTHNNNNVDENGNEHEHEHEQWSSAEDRLLVELVLEKLKLSKSDWQDCARSLGKDRGSVGRRWKSLMGGGEVGLKNGRRARIHATWRG